METESIRHKALRAFAESGTVTRNWRMTFAINDALAIEDPDLSLIGEGPTLQALPHHLWTELDLFRIGTHPGAAFPTLQFRISCENT